MSVSRETMILAVDFDGTLCLGNSWPNPIIGTPNLELIKDLIEIREAGHKLILYTCREGEFLTNAVHWCANFGLYFDAVNENVPESLKWLYTPTRKPYANYYIDDKAVNVDSWNTGIKALLVK